MIEEEPREEIIVIKRGGEGEEGHHGGAWKIAFADFMTAMMALFLVLWLINAANEETKKSVASYFNPVKLVDRNRSSKGLEDAKGPQESSEEDKAAEAEAAKTEGKDGEETAKVSDAELHANPYGVLAKIAASPAGQESPSAVRYVAPGNTGQSTGTAEGETFRDPFDPDFWRSEMDRLASSTGAPSDKDGQGEAVASLSGSEGTEEQLDHAAKTASTGLDGETDHAGKALEGEMEKPGLAKDGAQTAPGSAEDGEKMKPGAAAAGEKTSPGEADAGEKTKPGEAMSGSEAKPGATPDGEDREVGHASVEADLKPGETAKDGMVKGPADKEAEDIREELEAAVSRVAGIDPKLAGAISVMPSDDGILISLTDEWTIPMFNVGSAVPSRDLVLAMDKIAAVLAEKQGSLRIYGHTDARPYRGGSYDNWQLSVARAQSAYFMLVRGGIAKSRFSQVAGFADSRPRVADDPEAAANRRIEILLEGS